MINKKTACLILAVVLLPGIVFFGCEQFGSGGDVSNIFYGKWKLAGDNLPEGVNNLSVNFGASGSFNLAASVDIDMLLEIIGDDISSESVCFNCEGTGWNYWRDEPCFTCDGTGYIQEVGGGSIFEIIDIADLINVKTITFEIRGTYSNNGDSITIAPTEIKSNIFKAATSALKNVYNEYLDEILYIIGGSNNEVNVLIRELLNLLNINEILSELDKNLSGWVGTPQIKNILNYSYNKVSSSLTTKLNQLGMTEDDLADFFGDDEGEYPNPDFNLQQMSEPNEIDIMIAIMLYQVKMTLQTVKDAADEMLENLFSEIPPFEYVLEDGVLNLMDLTFTR